VELAQARLIESKNILARELEITKRSLDFRSIERDRLEAEVVKLKKKLGIRVTYGDDEVEPSDDENESSESASLARSESYGEQMPPSIVSPRVSSVTPGSASRLVNSTPILKRSNSKPLSTRK
jgi:hypothetical protein